MSSPTDLCLHLKARFPQNSQAPSFLVDSSSRYVSSRGGSSIHRPSVHFPNLDWAWLCINSLSATAAPMLSSFCILLSGGCDHSLWRVISVQVNFQFSSYSFACWKNAYRKKGKEIHQEGHEWIKQNNSPELLISNLPTVGVVSCREEPDSPR